MLGILIVLVLIGLIGALLLFSGRRLPLEEESLIEAVDRLLPQTQCAQCGFPGCRPYAEAILRGEADINQCPPGGPETVNALATLLNIEAKPLNPDYGVTPSPKVAFIDEARCIGCFLCIQACPVDAIVGAPRLMHTVVSSLCTGCELCIPPCPVDCIDLKAITGPLRPYAEPVHQEEPV